MWVEGFPVVHTVNEMYKDNSNWVNWSKSDVSLPKPIILEPYLTNKVLKSKSMLTISRALKLVAKGSVFENNVVDDSFRDEDGVFN